MNDLIQGVLCISVIFGLIIAPLLFGYITYDDFTHNYSGPRSELEPEEAREVLRIAGFYSLMFFFWPITGTAFILYGVYRVLYWATSLFRIARSDK